MTVKPFVLLYILAQMYIFLLFLDHKNAVENYLQSIKSPENNVNVAVAKLLFLGPSFQGKTVTRLRLTKNITNLSSNPSYDKSNTQMSEQTIVTCKNVHRGVVLAAEEGDDWEVVERIEQEVEMFIRNKSTHETQLDLSGGHAKSTPKYIPNEESKTEDELEQESLSSSTKEVVPSPSTTSVHLEDISHDLPPSNSIILSGESVQASAESILKKKLGTCSLNNYATQHLTLNGCNC